MIRMKGPKILVYFKAHPNVFFECATAVIVMTKPVCVMTAQNVFLMRASDDCYD